MLSRHGVEFAEKNVRDDLDAIRELVEMEVLSTPATVIDGVLVVGFDRQRLEALLSD